MNRFIRQMIDDGYSYDEAEAMWLDKCSQSYDEARDDELVRAWEQAVHVMRLEDFDSTTKESKC